MINNPSPLLPVDTLQRYFDTYLEIKIMQYTPYAEAIQVCTASLMGQLGPKVPNYQTCEEFRSLHGSFPLGLRDSRLGAWAEVKNARHACQICP